jgi:hypothetical protein
MKKLNNLEKIKFIQEFIKKYNIILPVSIDNLLSSDPSILDQIFQTILQRENLINEVPKFLDNLSKFCDGNFYDKLLNIQSETSLFLNDLKEELLKNVAVKLREDIDNIKAALNANDYKGIVNSIYECFSNIINGIKTCRNNIEKSHPNSMNILKPALTIASGALLANLTPISGLISNIYSLSCLFETKDNNSLEEKFDNLNIIINNIFEKDSKILSFANSFQNIAKNLEGGLSSLFDLKIDSSLINIFSEQISENSTAKKLVTNIIDMQKSFEDPSTYPEPLKNILNILPKGNKLTDIIGEINKSDKSSLEKLYAIYETISDSSNNINIPKEILKTLSLKQDLQKNISILGLDFIEKIAKPLKANKEITDYLGVTKAFGVKIQSLVSSLSSNIKFL